MRDHPRHARPPFDPLALAGELRRLRAMVRGIGSSHPAHSVEMKAEVEHTLHLVATALEDESLRRRLERHERA